MKTQTAVLLLSLTITGSSAVTMECLDCHGVSNVSLCHDTSVCQDTEVCGNQVFVVGERVQYKLSCIDRHLCLTMIHNGIDPLGGRPRREVHGVELCSACCAGDLCNKGNCFKLRNNMTIASLGTNPVVVG